MSAPTLTLGERLRRVKWFNLAVVTITPTLAIYGACTTQLQLKTLLFSYGLIVYTIIGITAGYHRLWSHRAYNASTFLKVFLMAGATSSVQGSCLWWCRSHRAHHRYTDTDLDPYSSPKGLVHTHIGWMLVEPEVRPGRVDISDLKKDRIVVAQHVYYFPFALFSGYILPWLIAGYGWGDWWGGWYFAVMARITVVHHCTFCINSIAHWLGEASYDDKHTPRDHFLSALITMGEGYHNFHHQFPMDYRNAVHWNGWDPTKWFIALVGFLGLATHLRRFPANEIAKGRLTMSIKKLKRVQDKLRWAPRGEELPIITWEEFQKESQARTLLLVSGFVHDATEFVDKHPGGAALVSGNSGKDMTAAFFGGVYEHSNAAHNLLSMMRVAALEGGVETLDEEQVRELIPPAQKLYIAVAAPDIPAPRQAIVSPRPSPSPTTS